jgi:hypothetical protein
MTKAKPTSLSCSLHSTIEVCGLVVERARNWTSFSSPWARAWDGHEVVDLAVGRLALHYAEENPDEVVAALDDKTEAVIRELEAQHREARRSLRRRRDRV